MVSRRTRKTQRSALLETAHGSAILLQQLRIVGKIAVGIPDVYKVSRICERPAFPQIG